MSPAWEFAIQQIKNIQLGGNTAYDYSIAALIFIGVVIVLKMFQMVVVARLSAIAKKSKNAFDDVLTDIVENLRLPFHLLIALFLSTKYLILHPVAEKMFAVIFVVTIAYEVIRAVEKIIEYALHLYSRKTREAGEDRKHGDSMIKSLRLVIRVILWILGLLLILSNLNVNVTSLIASLGIGGIAIALALQNVLGDMFNSFSIYIDKPFRVGDFIKLGDHMGTVERIGMKTTRVRTLQGEELVVSNTELTSGRVQNFKKMKERRVMFRIGVVYGTSQNNLKSIPKIIKAIVDKIDGIDYDRCHFAEYGAYSLDYEVVFFVKSANYKEYMDKRHKANIEIYKQFEKAGIEFAFPTRTLHIEKD